MYMTQLSDNDKKPLRGAQLAGLYPEPKTFEERVQEQRERDERQLRARPKWPALRAASLVTCIPLGVGLTYVFFVSVTINVISLVFFASLAMLIWMGLTWAVVKRIATIWRQWGLVPEPFYWACLVLAAPLCFGALRLATTVANGLAQQIGVAAAVYLVVTYVTARIIIAIQPS